MDLSILWYILITVLFLGYFFLEGFDYGVGILLPFLGKNDTERRAIVDSIGPHWDGNEVWLLTAGGAIFAAFPHWYATLFSGFYLALLIMLLALILRGVALEFRNRDNDPGWRNFWDKSLFVGSLVPALLWGVAITNLIQGVPINAKMQYAGSFWDLLSPFTLLGGLTWLLLFTMHGALFLTLKTEGEVAVRAHRAASSTGWLVLPCLILLLVLGYFRTDLFARWLTGIVILGALLVLILSCLLLRSRRYGCAFVSSGLSIILSTVAIFTGLFPRVMVSSLNPDWSLTIYKVSSSPYTLKIMTIVAITLVPIVLIYQGWSYWVFRRRVTGKQQESGY